MNSSDTCIAFADTDRIARGTVADVALAARRHLDADADACILVFDATTSEPVELDLRGDADDIRARYATTPGIDPVAEAPTPRGPGRPKLGVVAREVTLLPRHWEWLASQPGGASVTLRKLVENARRDSAGTDRARRAQDTAYRFMQAMAGNEPGFQEALRAMYAGDSATFELHTADWPTDVRDHARELAAEAFSAGEK